MCKYSFPLTLPYTYCLFFRTRTEVLYRAPLLLVRWRLCSSCGDRGRKRNFSKFCIVSSLKQALQQDLCFMSYAQWGLKTSALRTQVSSPSMEKKPQLFCEIRGKLAQGCLIPYGLGKLGLFTPVWEPFTLRAKQLEKHPRSQWFLTLQGAKEKTVSGLDIRTNL